MNKIGFKGNLRNKLKQFDFLVDLSDRYRDSSSRKYLLKNHQKFWYTRKNYLSQQYNVALSCKPEGYSIDHKASAVTLGGIEVNTSCNLNCPMCNTSLSNRSNNKMDLKLFEELVLLKKSRNIRKTVIHTIGEPLMNNHLEDYLEILKKHGLKLILITNGQLIDQRFGILKKYLSTLSYIGISIDGAHKNTYEILRPPGKFETLLKNLEKLQELKIEKRIYSTVSAQVKNELAYHLDFYRQFVPIENISLYLLTSHSPDNEFFDNNSLLSRHNHSLVPCPAVFNGHICFLSNGKISACERDYSGELIIGDARQDDIEEVINNDKILELRRMHIEGDIPKDHLCAECFEADPRVIALFSLFYETLVRKYSSNWNINEMQNRFDAFFDLFEDGIPNESQFLNLLH